jgi:hypothetical protein
MITVAKYYARGSCLGDNGMLQEDLDHFKIVLSQQMEELVGKAHHMVAELLERGETDRSR